MVADFNNDGKLDVVTVDYLFSSARMSILLQGTAVVTPNEVFFGYDTLGRKTAPHTITLTNSAVSPMTISALQIEGTNAPDFGETNNCPSSLSSGASCQIQVVFTPSIQGGTGEHAALQISDSGTGGMQTIRLNGHGTLLKAKPDLAMFGAHAVGTRTQPKTITITNTGQTSLSSGSAGITGGDLADNFTVASSNCAQLPAGGKCQVSVIFSPLWRGSIESWLKVTFDGDSVEVPLRGRGVLSQAHALH